MHIFHFFQAEDVIRACLLSRGLGDVYTGQVELTFEVRLTNDASSFVNELDAMQSVSRVALVSYNGVYMGYRKIKSIHLFCMRFCPYTVFTYLLPKSSVRIHPETDTINQAVAPADTNRHGQSIQEDKSL